MNTIALHEIAEKEKNNNKEIKKKIQRKHLKFLIYITYIKQTWQNLLNQRYYTRHLNLTNFCGGRP